MINSNVLFDKEFLNLLDKDNQREIYARIVSLNNDELPVEEISGKITQGSMNIDGTSAVRRSCSLTIVSNRVNINEYYWGFSTRFSLYIGMKASDYLKDQYQEQTVAQIDSTTGKIIPNATVIKPYENYPDIIWFKQGIFLITDFKINMNTNGTDNIYISGKDKMALLNGDIGGNFPYAIDVGTQEDRVIDPVTGIELDSTKTPLTIKAMVREMIHRYAGEPFHNIVINDLDDSQVELLEYKGEHDIYLLKNVSNGLFENVIFDGDVIRYDAYNMPIRISAIKQNELDTISTSLISKTAKRIKATASLLDRTWYTVVKCSYGSVVGYRRTDWTYPGKDGELIMNVGDTVSQALDKIVKALDDTFEYFYNIDGQFVFQKKLYYVNTAWNSLKNTWEETEAGTLQKITYAESAKLISQAQYSFLGNTLSTMVSNNPQFSNVKNDFSIWGKKKSSSEGKENSIHLRCAIDEKPELYKAFDGTIYSAADWDWRELIYQMALDYYNHNHDDDYEIQLHNNNPTYKFGKTGYEQYYTDILGFWRHLYNPESEDNETYILDQDDSTKYWNRNVFIDPSALLFWFDFLNGKETDLSRFSVTAIGDRTKVINDDKVRAIYYGEIPNIIYISQYEYEQLKIGNLLNDGYTYIILPEGMEEYFNISGKYKSAQDVLDDLIYQHTYCNDKISITSLPIYHLEPNVYIYVYDEKSKINGNYILEKLTCALNYNGTMQIQATKAPIRLY